MQTFFVIDSIKDLDKKVNLIINNIGDDIKFFVKASLYTKITHNAFVLKNIVGAYKNNEKRKIDEYLQSSNCVLDSTILYYSSVDIDTALLVKLREKSKAGYDSVFVKSKQNIFQKFGDWIYKTFAMFMYRVSDANCSPKLQAMSKAFMEYLQATTFCNHILEVKYKIVLEVGKNTSLTPKVKFNKYYLYDLIGFFALILGYILLEAFFNLRFFVYFAIVLGTILAIIVALMIACFSKFNARSKYKTKF